jgi:hypothetical protein
LWLIKEESFSGRNHSGLPDGNICKPKILILIYFEVLGYENVGIFTALYGHIEYFTAIGYILKPFGIFCGRWIYLFPFWYNVMATTVRSRSQLVSFVGRKNCAAIRATRLGAFSPY